MIGVPLLFTRGNYLKKEVEKNRILKKRLGTLFTVLRTYVGTQFKNKEELLS